MIVEKVVTEVEYVERVVEKIVEVPKIVERKVPSEPIIIEKIIPEYIFKDHIVEKLVYSEPEVVYIDRPVEIFVDRIVEVEKPVEVIKEVIKEVMVEKPVEVVREVVKYVTVGEEHPEGAATPTQSAEKVPLSAEKAAYPETNRRKSSSGTLSEENLPRSPDPNRMLQMMEGFSNEKLLDEDYLKERLERTEREFQEEIDELNETIRILNSEISEHKQTITELREGKELVPDSHENCVAELQQRSQELRRLAEARSQLETQLNDAYS